MHRSRVGVVLIDHPESSYAEAAAFWSAAVGQDRVAEDGPYESLGPLAGDLALALQRLGGGSQARVHLDIETDDVAAEVARLIG
ncbi:MAG: VOC family protein, partial [Nocardioides sp.]